MNKTSKKALGERQRFLAAKQHLSDPERKELGSINNELDKISQRKEARENCIVKKALDALILAMGRKPSYHRRCLLSEEIGTRLAPFIQTSIESHPLFEHASDKYIQHTVVPEFKTMLNTLWDKQKDDEDSYNDGDIHFKKLVNRKDLRVAYIHSSTVCSEVNGFIIMEKRNSEYKHDDVTHIRVAYTDHDSDYKKDPRYPKKPNIKFYEDRNYLYEYPILDENQVLTYNPNPEETWFNRVQHSFHYFSKINQAYGMLLTMVNCLEESNVKT
jgi:hypothetical protein